MRKQPYRVAFIGPWSARHLSDFSPAVHPFPFPDWAEFLAYGLVQDPELVVLFPEVDPGPPRSLPVSVLALEAADLGLAPGALETKLLLEAMKPAVPGPLRRVLGTAPAMARLRGSLMATSQTLLPLLVTGENGTGKDLAASVVHDLSDRCDRPFVAVNCGAVPTGLAESEFFGCVRGAFTGAENRTGYCQQAMGGTLFLDEIGELAPEIQAKLLRVLENHEIRRVGSCRVETADFRVICATNRDLGAEVRAGRFREDLYYRINVLNLKMPALRDRKEDLPLLAAHFLESESKALGKLVRVGRKALAKMAQYDWPGNLRQLRNVVLRGAVLHPGNELEPGHIDWES